MRAHASILTQLTIALSAEAFALRPSKRVSLNLYFLVPKLVRANSTPVYSVAVVEMQRENDIYDNACAVQK